mgnify:CR=1 FL=1
MNAYTDRSIFLNSVLRARGLADRSAKLNLWKQAVQKISAKRGNKILLQDIDPDDFKGCLLGWQNFQAIAASPGSKTEIEKFVLTGSLQ